MSCSELPYVFDIKRSSLDDGPGMRTMVFLKGCPLNCVWCHNPESHRPEREIFADKERCISCGDCQSVCEARAVVRGEIDREICQACGCCAEICPTLALKCVGQQYAVEELVAELLKDLAFFRATGGGVTFSGGEPTQHSEYLSKVMSMLKREGVHIALQTCGLFDWNEFEPSLLPHIDLLYFDLKFVDSGLHRFYTGKGNQQILNNFSAMTKESSAKTVPCIPLIPGLTATKENLAQIADLLKKNNIREYQLLPYHSGGVKKAGDLGRENVMEISMLSQGEEAGWREYFATCFDNHIN
ncbi:MAG: glycyl-radical enzyme activating protein [Desulfuromonadales bacterium]|nr:glycyl-radical enzyme activating protein [Desulfuromonadales bacterium]